MKALARRALLVGALVASACQPLYLDDRGSATSRPESLPWSFAGGAAVAASNRIYVFKTDGLAFDYDPTSRTWSELLEMPSAMSSLAAVLSGGTIFVFGESLFAYDLTAGTWSTKTPLTPARTGAAVAADSDGRIYVVGGTSTDGAPPEVYDPATDAWTLLPTAPVSGVGLSAFAKDGIVVVAGPTAASFLVSAQTWSALSAPHVPRSNAATGTVEGHMVLAGGEANGVATASVEILDLTTDAWTFQPIMRAATADAAGTTSADGRIWVLGGNVPGGDGKLVQVYDPQSGAWFTSE